DPGSDTWTAVTPGIGARVRSSTCRIAIAVPTEHQATAAIRPRIASMADVRYQITLRCGLLAPGGAAGLGATGGAGRSRVSVMSFRLLILHANCPPRGR